MAAVIPFAAIFSANIEERKMLEGQWLDGLHLLSITIHYQLIH